jgi:hypothetical protein
MCLCLPGWKSQFYKDCAKEIPILGREQSEYQYLNFAVTYDTKLRFATSLAGTMRVLCADQNEQINQSINQSACVTYIHNVKLCGFKTFLPHYGLILLTSSGYYTYHHVPH